MLLTTLETLQGYEITETLGMVRANTVRTRHVGKDILAALRNIIGGEIVEYTKMLAESREQVMDRLENNARELDADAIVCIRFTTSAVMQGAAELLAYGTAVKLKKIQK
jgi:uncharacterized protein YbjQ (UPF0145 family)